MRLLTGICPYHRARRANCEICRSALQAALRKALGGQAVCCATISSDTSHRRWASPASCNKGLPAAIWQFDQNSPVIPLTLGFAASNAWVAAPRAADFMNNCAADTAILAGRPAFLLRPVPRVAPG